MAEVGDPGTCGWGPPSVRLQVRPRGARTGGQLAEVGVGVTEDSALSERAWGVRTEAAQLCLVLQTPPPVEAGQKTGRPAGRLAQGRWRGVR